MTRLKTILVALALTLFAYGTWAAGLKPAAPVVKLVPVTPVGPSPITPDCRYLFVVDTSAAMQRYADGLYRSTHRLIATGLGGRMRDGDVFTVWTYADTVLTREFPLNAWTPELNVALANRAYEFLAHQKFSGKSNLRPVFAELGQALAIATNLTVILVSDGTDVIVGTPFDRAINVTYGKRASEMRSAKMPFITALATERGEFTQWSVRGGLEDIGLALPIPPVIAPAPVPPPVVVITPEPVKTPLPVVVTAPAPQPTPVVAPPLVVPTPIPPPKPLVITPAPATPAPVPTVVIKPVPPTNAVVSVPAPKPVEPAPSKPVIVPTPVVAIPKTNQVASLPPTPKPELPQLPLPTPAPPKPAPIVSEPKIMTNVVAPKPDLKPPAPPAAVQIPSPNPPIAPKPTTPAPVATLPVLPSLPTPPPTKVELIPLPAPVIPLPLPQPKRVTEISNALAKVELLRPPVSATSAPPSKPLEARVISPVPAPPAPSPIVTPPKPVSVIPTNPPKPMLVTNSRTNIPTPVPVLPGTPPKTEPIVRIVPPPVVPKLEVPATNLPAIKTNAVAAVVPKPLTNAPPVRTNTLTTAAKTSVLTNDLKAKMESTAVKPVPKPIVADAKGVTNAPAAPAKPAGQLAVATPGASGGWHYLAAAIALLLAAGGIIAYLLRPQPNPSAISQSIDDKRV